MNAVQINNAKSVMGLTSLRLLLALETLLIFSIVQGFWYDLSMFRDDFKFGDLPWALRVTLPKNSLSDSAIPWPVACTILFWQSVGSFLSVILSTKMEKYVSVIQCQVGLGLVGFFWVSEIARMGSHQVAAASDFISSTPQIMVGATIFVFFATEIISRIGKNNNSQV